MVNTKSVSPEMKYKETSNKCDKQTILIMDPNLESERNNMEENYNKFNEMVDALQIEAEQSQIPNAMLPISERKRLRRLSLQQTTSARNIPLNGAKPMLILKNTKSTPSNPQKRVKHVMFNVDINGKAKTNLYSPSSSNQHHLATPTQTKHKALHLLGLSTETSQNSAHISTPTVTYTKSNISKSLRSKLHLKPSSSATRESYVNLDDDQEIMDLNNNDIMNMLGQSKSMTPEPSHNKLDLNQISDTVERTFAIAVESMDDKKAVSKRVTFGENKFYKNRLRLNRKSLSNPVNFSKTAERVVNEAILEEDSGIHQVHFEDLETTGYGVYYRSIFEIL